VQPLFQKRPVENLLEETYGHQTADYALKKLFEIKCTPCAPCLNLKRIPRLRPVERPTRKKTRNSCLHFLGENAFSLYFKQEFAGRISDNDICKFRAG
jgi:hypothetical protein